MNKIYLFNSDGMCFCSSSINNKYSAEDVAKLNGAVNFFTSEKYFDINNIFYYKNNIYDIPQKPSGHHDFDYTSKQWVANSLVEWATVKELRAQFLSNTDWMVTKATEAGQTVLPEWAAYRQSLRDITLQADPFNIVWPVAPQ